MIKDNHIAASGGIAKALSAARASVGHMVKIEIEVDGLGQLEEALAHGADVVLLDNMTPADMKKAVAVNNGSKLQAMSPSTRCAPSPKPASM